MGSPLITEIELVIVAIVYAAAGLAFVQAFLLRRAAVREWRRAIGGRFDKRQHKFATELEIDRARLPPEAQKKLLDSRRVLVAASLVLMAALALNLYVMRPR
ncbi:MAG: hypothetical protein HXY28_12585 [Hydrogenophilaceae bacterium]|jgi:hypothetical protein|nr:hypothetical protein [Hydrogenophilaceae bacterium]